MQGADWIGRVTIVIFFVGGGDRLHMEEWSSGNRGLVGGHPGVHSGGAIEIWLEGTQGCILPRSIFWWLCGGRRRGCPGLWEPRLESGRRVRAGGFGHTTLLGRLSVTMMLSLDGMRSGPREVGMTGLGKSRAGVQRRLVCDLERAHLTLRERAVWRSGRWVAGWSFQNHK